MHILMVTASLPYPPHQGGAIRAYGILHGLYHAGHKITLLSFHDQERGVDATQTPLAKYCVDVITIPTPSRSTSQRLQDLLLTNQADIARRLASQQMQDKITQLISSGNFDLVQFEGIEVASYLLEIRHTHPQLPTIYDAFNAEAALQQVIAQVDRSDFRRLPSAIYSYLQVGRVQQFERSICESATAVVAVSNEDADQLRRFRTDNKIYVVPSGVFVDDYTNSSHDMSLKPNALVFTGKMDYRPNVDAMTWFADAILPHITRQTDAHLYIVGQKPHKRLDSLRETHNIEITGWVEAVQPYLHAADIYVAPLRMGSGTRLKILEAMASSCALVATTIAASGLSESAHNHMIIADNETEMAQAVVNLLQQPQKRVKLGEGAREYVRTHYDWSVLIPRLLDAYRDIGIV